VEITSRDKTPVIFLSHGAPTLVTDDIPARAFIKGLGPRFRDVRAVLCISAHWETDEPTVNALNKPSTIHDFYGFPDELYKVNYPAHGSPSVADDVVKALSESGIHCEIDHARGLDHGAWVPLSLMFPEANISIVQLSIQHNLDPAKYLDLGHALQPLRDKKILILGSGGAVHPLGYFTPRFDGSPPEKWATDFEAWLTDKVRRGDNGSLLEYRRRAPYPERAHPRPDHRMPLIVVVGAAGVNVPGVKIHDSWTWGDLGMGAYEFV
jgi:4,5-DOPA dioxygenase extradiol